MAVNSNRESQATDIFSPDFLLANVGAPFLIGAAVGYFAKKMLKVALFVGGGLIVLAFAGEYLGIVSINDALLQNATQLVAYDASEAGGYVVNRLGRITSQGVSAAGGFFVGFKLG